MPSTNPNSRTDKLIKYGALALLVCQNSAVALVTSRSRTVNGPKFVSTTAVFMIEIIKFLICLLVVWSNGGFNVKIFCETMAENMAWKEIVLISVPAFVYTIQNNLLFIALEYLDPTTFQLCYQGKIITTAIFSVVMLKKVLSITQWVSLSILTVGVALTQLSKTQEAAAKDDTSSAKLFTGFMTVMIAICLSGFAGVYFEKILKKNNSNLWLRNIQLGMTSLLLSVGAIYMSGDIHEVQEKGFFYGYSPIVWASILLQAVGGLLVAVVVKYADNILKGFAASFAMVITFSISMIFDSFYPNQTFYMGAVLINLSIYLYSTYPPKMSVDETPENSNREDTDIISPSRQNLNSRSSLSNILKSKESTISKSTSVDSAKWV